jgi:hypothetical protein
VTNIQIKEAHESFRKGGFGEVAGGVDRMDAQQMAILYDDNCGRNLSKCGTATGAARIENLGLDALINALLDAVDRVVNFFATSPCTALDRSTDAYAALSCPAQAAQIEGYCATLIPEATGVAGGYRATGARGLREGDGTFWRTRVQTSGWGPACPPFESGGTTMRVALARMRSHGGGGAGLPARRREQPHDDKGVVNRMAAKN